MGHTELFPECSECKKYLRHEVPAPFVEPLHQSSQSGSAEWSGGTHLYFQRTEFTKK